MKGEEKCRGIAEEEGSMVGGSESWSGNRKGGAGHREL